MRASGQGARRCPKYVGFRLPLFGDALALPPPVFFQFGEMHRPPWIKDFRVGASGTLINKGLQGSET